MLSPVGNASPEEIADEFSAQILDTRAAYDMILFETMFDLREALIAVASARKHASVPVAATLTFMKNPARFFTIMGDDPALSMRKLQAAGAGIVGANCTIASAEMLELARALRESTDLPLLCQPNAASPASWTAARCTIRHPRTSPPTPSRSSPRASTLLAAVAARRRVSYRKSQPG